MRIGIITFHRAHNYGAFLQCYALQEFLLNLGHDVHVIDYDNWNISQYYQWRDKNCERLIWANPIKCLWRLYLYIKNKRIPRKRYLGFKRCQEKLLRLSNTQDIFNNPFNLIVIGSDQVWSTEITGGLDQYYWGNFPHPSTTKIVTYAACVGKEWENDSLPEITKLLMNFDYISVREDWGKKYIKGLYPNIIVQVHADPTLLLPSSFWKSNAICPKVKGNYAFYYQVNHNEEAINMARKMAKERNLPLYVLSAEVNGVNSRKSHAASPLEFLGWILYADLIITSSFHGTAFSILFNKDFYTIKLNIPSDHRMENILKFFHLEDRFVKIGSEVSAPMFERAQIESNLIEMKKSAKLYFENLCQ